MFMFSSRKRTKPAAGPLQSYEVSIRKILIVSWKLLAVTSYPYAKSQTSDFRRVVFLIGLSSSAPHARHLGEYFHSPLTVFPAQFSSLAISPRKLSEANGQGNSFVWNSTGDGDSKLQFSDREAEWWRACEAKCSPRIAQESHKGPGQDSAHHFRMDDNRARRFPRRQPK